ncbi:MAG: hypothetical protein AAGA90_00285 [Actinomycetota bacterium]
MTTTSPMPHRGADKPLGMFIGLFNALALYTIVGVLIALAI